jgi:phosphoglycolate phosphatase
VSFKAILFDLDGTLLDTLEDIADATNAALHALGVKEYPVSDYKIFVGDGVETLIERVLPPDQTDPAARARCAALMREEYSQRWWCKSRPYRGIPGLLDELARRTVPIAVLSNKPHNFTQLCVGRLLPQWRFEAVLGMSADRPKKPHPAGALEIATQMQVRPDEVLYLGDTNTDMQTAVAAGMYPVGVLWGFREAAELLDNGAKQLIADPSEVLNILAADRPVS